MSVIISSWVCWVILALSFLCYERIIGEFISCSSKGGCFFCLKRFQTSQVFISVIIVVLPLLGLLGTIIGLLQCFMGLTNDQQNDSLADGISVALVSTQLALLCVLPAYFLNSVLIMKVENVTKRVEV